MGECTKNIYEIRERYRSLENDELWTHQEELIEKLKQFFIRSECNWIQIKDETIHITYIEYKDGRILDKKGENLLWSDYENVAALVNYLTEQKIL